MIARFAAREWNARGGGKWQEAPKAVNENPGQERCDRSHNTPITRNESRDSA